MSEFTNPSWVSLMIGKLPNLNIGYIKSVDLTGKQNYSMVDFFYILIKPLFKLKTKFWAVFLVLVWFL